MKALILSVVATVAITGFASRPAAAAPPMPVRILTVVNNAGIGPYRLRMVEQAVQRQAATAGRWWYLPRVKFAAGGWPVTLQRDTACSENDAAGCHYLTDDGTPYAEVDVREHTTGAHWTTTFSHEVLEMLANPYLMSVDQAGDMIELCDWTEGMDYLSRGVWLSDFMLPTAFTNAPHGRLDFMDAIGAKQLAAEKS